jgi:insulysin
METRSDGPDSNESEGEKLDREKFEGKNLDTEELQTVVLSSTTSGDYPDRSSPLYSTLSRFAKFFIEPLFSESTVSREMERIGEEHDKNKQSDLWRLDQLERSLSNPKHPYNHFGTGNYETLKAQPEAKGVNIRDRFMEFHDKYYSANRSQLVVFAKEPLDTLEAWVSSLFSGFQNKNLPQNRWETDVLFGESDLMTQCFVKPVMDSRHLHLSFPFIDEECDYESQASQYITQLIDHEGSGSIMAYIKSMGWATSLQTYKTSICPGTAGMFNCRIGLTEKGLKNYRKIVIVFFEYISLLCESQPQEWFYQELKKMADNRFESEVNVTAETLTEKISLAMGTTLPTKWLLGSLR